MTKRMKKLTIFCLLLSVTLAAKAQFSSGSGSPTDPYIITDAAQLDQVRNHLSAHFRLEEDINLAEYINTNYSSNGWLPIGDNGNEFTGSFHGGGHTISGLKIDRSSTENIGLFGYLDGAEIDSLGIVDCNITGTNYVGGLVGYNDFFATIKNCYVSGNVTANDAIVGGLAGINNK